MPTVDAFTLIRRPWRMTMERRRGRFPRAASRKRKTVPSGFIDQPDAGASSRAHSLVSGLLISSDPPRSVGSSLPPGRGATIEPRAIRSSLDVSRLWRRDSDRAAIVSSMPLAGPARAASANSTVTRRQAVTLEAKQTACPASRPDDHSPAGSAARDLYMFQGSLRIQVGSGRGARSRVTPNSAIRSTPRARLLPLRRQPEPAAEPTLP